MRKRVVVTGIGWVTPLGHDIESVWKNLLGGVSGVAPTTLFDATTFPTSFAAEVKNYDFRAAAGESYPHHQHVGRNTQFLVGAGIQAWEMAGLPLPGAATSSGIAPLDPYSVGIYTGAGEGGLADFDKFAHTTLESRPEGAAALDTKIWASTSMKVFHPLREIEQEPSLTMSHLAMQFNARGPSLNCLTACAASTQAIGEATEFIRRGEADIMISGGAHSMIHPFGVTGFNRLTALSTFNDNPQGACRPFDATRGGFVLGEGAGVVILESLEHAIARGAEDKILGEIVGYGSSCDAFAVTDQHPEGRGAVVAINEALKDAGLTPKDIDYINAHGTGTKENDSTETFAVKTTFGDHAKNVPMSSIKSMMGHLIAAAGVVEMITCLLTIRDNIIPPTANYATPDPECDLDYVPNTARKATVNVAMSNSFGFGGQNDTLIVKRYVA
jgi:3-oxoacyl-[acyl-carrier-protein] synthase II